MAELTTTFVAVDDLPVDALIAIEATSAIADAGGGRWKIDVMLDPRHSPCLTPRGSRAEFDQVRQEERGG